MGVPAGLAVGSYQGARLNERGTVVGDGQIVVLEPETWVGKRFPLLEHVDGLGDQLTQGEWIVVLSRHNCARCQEEIPSYEKLARSLSDQETGKRVALIEAPPYHNNGGMPRTACAYGTLSDANEWFFPAPVEVHVSDGKVTEVSQPSEGPSPQPES